jgi:hypothetical protein
MLIFTSCEGESACKPGSGGIISIEERCFKALHGIYYLLNEFETFITDPCLFLVLCFSEGVLF